MSDGHDNAVQPQALQRFRSAYAEHRRREGRDGIPVHQFPYIRHGPQRKTWSVRARSFDVVVRCVITRLEDEVASPLTTLDLGAGNGWFSYQMARRGHNAIAVDVRSDDVDGLGALDAQRPVSGRILTVVGDFARLPLARAVSDVTVFNSSFHYATSVTDPLSEAVRVTRSGGRIVIVDTPFYRTEEQGNRMIVEKNLHSGATFGDLVDDLTSIPFIEYLTSERLATASAAMGITWKRHRVRYPLWYELRPLLARARRKRRPSRFDVWEGLVT